MTKLSSILLHFVDATRVIVGRFFIDSMTGTGGHALFQRGWPPTARDSVPCDFSRKLGILEAGANTAGCFSAGVHKASVWRTEATSSSWIRRTGREHVGTRVRLKFIILQRATCFGVAARRRESAGVRWNAPYDASPNGLLQHGHSPSWPLTSDQKALGCGSVMIALKASGARWA